MYNEYVKWCMYLAKCPSLQFIFYLTNEFMVTEYVFFSEVNVTISDICLQAIILTSLHGWNTDWAITWDRIRIVKLYSFF